MYLIVLFFLAALPCGYVFESFYYTFQRMGRWSRNAKIEVVALNIAMVLGIWVLNEKLEDPNLDNFTDIDKFLFLSLFAISASVAGANGFSIGCYIRSQMRYLNNEGVPAHLVKSEEDAEREAKIHEARKEERYKWMEDEVGLVAEPEPEYKKDEVDHEAELEDILKSRK